MRDHAGIIAAERQLLRFFCQEASRAFERDFVLQKAGHYLWREPEHQAFYNALSQLRAASPAQLRERLPSRLTALGFPDVVWEDLFEPSDLTEARALQMLRELTEG